MYKSGADVTSEKPVAGFVCNIERSILRRQPLRLLNCKLNSRTKLKISQTNSNKRFKQVENLHNRDTLSTF